MKGGFTWPGTNLGLSVPCEAGQMVQESYIHKQADQLPIFSLEIVVSHSGQEGRLQVLEVSSVAGLSCRAMGCPVRGIGNDKQLDLSLEPWEGRWQGAQFSRSPSPGVLQRCEGAWNKQQQGGTRAGGGVGWRAAKIQEGSFLQLRSLEVQGPCLDPALDLQPLLSSFPKDLQTLLFPQEAASLNRSRSPEWGWGGSE